MLLAREIDKALPGYFDRTLPIAILLCCLANQFILIIPSFLSIAADFALFTGIFSILYILPNLMSGRKALIFALIAAFPLAALSYLFVWFIFILSLFFGIGNSGLAFFIVLAPYAFLGWLVWSRQKRQTAREGF